MSGTKRSCRIEDLRKIFARKGWDKDFQIKGSEPYDKGCEVYNMNHVGGVPFVTQRFDKNDDLFVAIVGDPENYHPGKPLHATPGLFDNELKDGMIQSHPAMMRQTIEKLEGLYKSFRAMTHILPIDINERYIETQIQKYKNKVK